MRLSESQQDKAENSQSFARYVQNFLEHEVRPPFKYRQISPLSFALNARCADEVFYNYIFDLHAKLLEFLFGSERNEEFEVLLFAGSDLEVAEFLTESDEDARKRAKRFMSGLTEDIANDTLTNKPAPLARMSGKRGLVYRGIMAVPQRVLLAWAITPSADSTGTQDYRAGDIDLARYLDFRGEEAIDFTIRIFEKASFYLQTSGAELRSMILLVPLAYSSVLSNQDMERFRIAVHNHPEWVRRQIFLSVFNAPANASSTMIQRFMSEFTRLFRTIDWQIKTTEIDPGRFIGSRMHSVTFDMHAIRNNRTQHLLDFIAMEEAFRRLQIRTGVSGLKDKSELMMVATSRIFYASGDAVTGPLPNPAPAQKVDHRDLPILEPTVLDLRLEVA